MWTDGTRFENLNLKRLSKSGQMQNDHGHAMVKKVEVQVIHFKNTKL